MNWLPRRQRFVRARLIQWGFAIGMSVGFLAFIWFGLFIAAEYGL